MPDRILVYVDGESHFIRSEAAWRSLHGPDACLGRLRLTSDNNDQLILFVEKAKVFWTRAMNPGAARSVYFTSAVADPSGIHQISIALRDFNLEPQVTQELRQLAEKRANKYRDAQIIEKPKGVDIGLAVRMLEDAFHQHFDLCHLYTSDVDFLPAIKAVMGRGKRVCVFGYKNGLSSESKLLHVPDQFVDLEEMLRTDCVLMP